MTWLPPTVAEFDERYPEFALRERSQVEGELADAIDDVSRGDWIDRDRTPAALSLTAHRLSVSGQGVPVGGSGGTGTPAGAVIKAREVGDTRTEFAYPGTEPSSGSSDNEYLSTTYGRRFYRLLRLNFPAFRSLDACR